jgi:hypothetical protein
MKKFYTFFMVIGLSIAVKAQLVINENFTGYTTGGLSGQGGWVPNVGVTDVQVANTMPLTYSGYTSGSQYITVSNIDGIDPHKPFAVNINTTVSRTIFMSFLVRVTSAPEPNQSPAYSIALRNTANANYPARFYVAEKQGASTQLAFGIAVGSAAPLYTNEIFAYNTTYLIVIRYDVVAAGDDLAYLWVNPSLAAEPAIGAAAGNTGATSATGEVAYGTELNALQVFQSSTTGTPVTAFDAFRVSTGASSFDAWNNLSPAGAPLPVKLDNFNAAKDGSAVKLVWRSNDENNLSNYIIERSTDGRTYSTIGTVDATNKGNYAFTDLKPATDYNFYRLKMANADGTYKLSHIVSIKSKATLSLMLSPNPVRSSLQVQHPKVSNAGRLQVINTEGKLIKDVQLPANSVMTTIDLSGFSSGLYNIVFKSDATVFSKMVLKQ